MSELSLIGKVDPNLNNRYTNQIMITYYTSAVVRVCSLMNCVVYGKRQVAFK